MYLMKKNDLLALNIVFRNSRTMKSSWEHMLVIDTVDGILSNKMKFGGRLIK